MDSENAEQQEKQKPETLDLEAMSITALTGYVRDLKNEIQRVEIEIDFKREARREADDHFK